MTRLLFETEHHHWGADVDDNDDYLLTYLLTHTMQQSPS
jgi:hypothetical protein